MKSLIRKIVTVILTLEMRVHLRRRRPEIIGITGTVGKTSTKEATYAVLAHEHKTFRSEKSYNSAIGIPLTVLGLHSAYNSVFGWISNVLRGAVVMLQKGEFDVLVLEMGVDRPKDFDHMLKYIRPSIGVVTAIGDIPVHVEFFSGPDAVAREKAKLVKALPENGFAILNADDEKVLAMQEKTKATVLTYGLSEDAMVRATNFHILHDEGEMLPVGITFKLEYDGKTVPMRIYHAFGKQQLYTALAAASVGIAKGMNLIAISEALREYTPPPGRLRRIEGQKNTIILDDTYNSSPLAVHAALEVLAEFPVKRKIAVLGDMLELGKYAVTAHEEVGKRVAKSADLLVAIGPRSKFIVEAARARKMKASAVKYFATSEEAAKFVEGELKDGDVVLVKGSQGMRCEKVVERIMARPQDAKDLLVRQDAFWKKGSLKTPVEEMLWRIVGVILFILGLLFLFINLFIGIVAFLVSFGIFVKK